MQYISEGFMVNYSNLRVNKLPKNNCYSSQGNMNVKLYLLPRVCRGLLFLDKLDKKVMSNLSYLVICGI